ncbi:MAG: cytochrome P450 [Pseudomonadota bacterium]
MALPTLTQSPTDPDFVQDPYPFYARARALGPLFYWADYAMPATTTFAATRAILRDRRFGRAPLVVEDPPAHLAPFHAVEQHSLLQLEPPDHTRLRGLILRAFTSRRITALVPEIEAMCHARIDAFPDGPFDLLPAYATPIPVAVICRLLGVPQAVAGDLLRWSNTMVAMYQARRDRKIEDAAAQAATEFSDFLKGYIDQRRKAPGDDLITQLIAAEEDGARLSTDELISICILLLNAGHEATVHTIGNGAKALIAARAPADAFTDDRIEATVEEVMRYDPPLHIFTRIAYEDMELFGHPIRRGDEVACLLAAAAHDPAETARPDVLDLARPAPQHLSLGAGLHFCVGAPLARLELQIALRALFTRCPDLRITDTPRYANLYHFHGLEALMVTRD